MITTRQSRETRSRPGDAACFLEVFFYLQTLHSCQPPSESVLPDFNQKVQGRCAGYAVWILDCLFEGLASCGPEGGAVEYRRTGVQSSNCLGGAGGEVEDQRPKGEKDW